MVAIMLSNVQSFSGMILSRRVQSRSLTMEYIPDGMSKAQWQKLKDAEEAKAKGKNKLQNLSPSTNSTII